MSNCLDSRIFLAVGRYPPAHGGGGLRAHRAYQRLRRKKDVRLWVITESDDQFGRGISCYESVQVVRITRNAGYIRSVLEVGWLFLSSGVRNISHVHAMGMSYVAMAASIWSQFFRIPLVRELTVNGDIPTGTGLLQRICRYGFTHADLVIALSREIEKTYLSAGVSPDRIWRRPNPVDTSIFHPPQLAEYLDARKHYGFTEYDIVHLVLARFHPRKNQRLAIETLANLPENHHLLLAGPRLPEDEAYYDEVSDAICTHGLGNRVHLVPEFIDNPVQLYHLADTYWVPSVLEGLPNTMLEALCSGLPVVVNSQLGLADYIDEGKNGFQAKPDPQEFAVAADRVVNLGLSLKARNSRAKKTALLFDAAILDGEFAKRIAQLH